MMMRMILGGKWLAVFGILSVFASASSGVVKLELERSSDLRTWQDVRVNIDMLAEDGGILFDAGGADVFFRLRVGEIEGGPEGFVSIPGGIYQRGDNHGELAEWTRPAHHVYVSPFYIAEAPVSYGEWEDVYEWATGNGYDFAGVGLRGWDAESGTELSEGDQNDQHPVVRVHWTDVLKWLNARSEMEGRTPVYYTDSEKTEDDIYREGDELGMTADQVKWDANGYRLPTEAEWEKAARGGLGGERWPWGDEEITSERANYGENEGGTTPVRSYAPNGYGLYDMAGNVWDGVWDYGTWLEGTADDPEGTSDDWYSQAGASEPDTRGPETGWQRIIRGGGWSDAENRLRTAYRSGVDSGLGRTYLGFRPVVSIP